ncbi:carboxypeptidase regulatory-like domain-containing protein, partial [uncultured Algoriphagus sp.]|uniref:carboxypeptidase regulatory-like domain-containing protein n=1 Tax=uncultured Algoriphagus sp. TaxID=417365 RepID=UPI002593C2B5
MQTSTFNPMQAFIATMILLTLTATSLLGQQQVKGTVSDAQSEYPLFGATVILLDSDPIIGTTTDEDGNFRLEGIPLGRQNFQVQYLG